VIEINWHTQFSIRSVIVGILAGLLVYYTLLSLIGNYQLWMLSPEAVTELSGL
jgi:hypothetical protein